MPPDPRQQPPIQPPSPYVVTPLNPPETLVLQQQGKDPTLYVGVEGLTTAFGVGADPTGALLLTATIKIPKEHVNLPNFGLLPNQQMMMKALLDTVGMVGQPAMRALVLASVFKPKEAAHPSLLAALGRKSEDLLGVFDEVPGGPPPTNPIPNAPVPNLTENRDNLPDDGAD